MATAIMKQKEVPEMDDVEKVISKISEESPYKRRPTQKRTWMTVPERYESILSALKNGTPIRLNIIKLPEKNQGKNWNPADEVINSISKWVYLLPDPELIDFDGDFRVNMYRNTAIDYSPRVNDRVNDKVNDRVNEIEEKILKFIDNDPAITITQLSMELELSRKTIAAKLKTLKEKKWLSE